VVDVGRLAEDYWDTLLEHSPLGATLLGDHRFDELVPDASEEREQELAAALERIGAAADEIDEGRLEPDERLTLAVLRFRLRVDVRAVRDRIAEFAVSPYWGPQRSLLLFAHGVTLPEPEHAEALPGRYRRVGHYLDTAADRLRTGVARGRTPAQPLVNQTIEQIDGLLRPDPAESDFTTGPTPPPSWDESRIAAWREQLSEAVAEGVLPGFARYRQCLADEIAPHARPPERAGLCWLPDGEEVYAAAIVGSTTVEMPADEIHDLGLQGIAALADEYRDMGGPVLRTDDVAEILDRLRHDEALRFSTPQEIVAQAESALSRAVAAVPGWFGSVPETPCHVREMTAEEGEHGTIAYYMPPAQDGSRPGSYFVNTTHPETRTRYESEALAFHEAVPGHHLQIGLAQEQADLPSLRRHSLVTAYVEGWALYTERLADEMGLYSGEVERLGMLSFDSWRSGRLVVDTGMHAKGWSRQQAIDYLVANSPQAENNIRNEVDRYIGRPGQALAYKIGQREIFRLRRLAEEALGEGFDIRRFHDAVLLPGPLPLAVLATSVEKWISDEGA
jgi:uncharacterized protein (DUF885 family)